jgi:hypothetical protein
VRAVALRQKAAANFKCGSYRSRYIRLGLPAAPVLG